MNLYTHTHTQTHTHTYVDLKTEAIASITRPEQQICDERLHVRAQQLNR